MNSKRSDKPKFTINESGEQIINSAVANWARAMVKESLQEKINKMNPYIIRGYLFIWGYITVPYAFRTLKFYKKDLTYVA